MNDEHGLTTESVRLTEPERVALFTAAKAEWLPPMGRDPLLVAVERIITGRLAPLRDLVDRADVEAREHQHLSRLSTWQVRDALRTPPE